MLLPERILGPSVFAFAGAALLAAASLGADAAMVCAAKVAALEAARSGALAGAGVLATGGTDARAAETVARAFGEKPRDGRHAMRVGAGDVLVDLEDGHVLVTARGDAPLPTILAHVLAGEALEVEATARAAVDAGSAATCLRPWILADGFEDAAHDGSFGDGDTYAPGVTSWGTGHRGAAKDRGRTVALRPGAIGSEVGAFHAIALDEDEGDAEAAYLRNIIRCSDAQIAVGTAVRVLPGDLAEKTRAGMRALIGMDPEARWDETAGRVARSAWPPGASPRIVRVAFHDPRIRGRAQEPPASLTVVNIGALFLEASPDGGFSGRMLPAPGFAPDHSGSRTAPMTRAARLIR